jgi:hypothetical protein
MVLWALCVWGGVAQADCGAGPQPTFVIPDGHLATEDEMLAAQRNVEHYNDEIRAYAQCLQSEQVGQIADSKDDAGQLRRKYANLTSAAVAQLVSVADCLNQQVIAFRNGGGGTHAQPAACSARSSNETIGSSGGAGDASRSTPSASPAGKDPMRCAEQCREDAEVCETNAIARELIVAASQAAAPASGGMCSADEMRCDSQCRGRYDSN